MDKLWTGKHFTYQSYAWILIASATPHIKQFHIFRKTSMQGWLLQHCLFQRGGNKSQKQTVCPPPGEHEQTPRIHTTAHCVREVVSKGLTGRDSWAWHGSSPGVCTQGESQKRCTGSADKTSVGGRQAAHNRLVWSSHGSLTVDWISLLLGNTHWKTWRWPARPSLTTLTWFTKSTQCVWAVCREQSASTGRARENSDRGWTGVRFYWSLPEICLSLKLKGLE